MLGRSVLVNALLNYTLERELQLRVILVLRNMWCINRRTFGEDWMILHPVREESPNWVRDQNWRLCGQCFVENSHTICRGVTRWVNMVSFRLRCAIKKERASASEWQIKHWTSSPNSYVSLGTSPTNSSSEKLGPTWKKQDCCWSIRSAAHSASLKTWTTLPSPPGIAAHIQGHRGWLPRSDQASSTGYRALGRACPPTTAVPAWKSR